MKGHPLKKGMASIDLDSMQQRYHESNQAENQHRNKNMLGKSDKPGHLLFLLLIFERQVKPHQLPPA